MATVLVTGGTGFLGAHTIARLLVGGHQVRTTIRSLSRQADVEAMLRTTGAPDAGSVRYFPADLTADDGWAEAAAGADYVVHVASPFPGAAPENEDELIVPARAQDAAGVLDEPSLRGDGRGEEEGVQRGAVESFPGVRAGRGAGC